MSCWASIPEFYDPLDLVTDITCIATATKGAADNCNRMPRAKPPLKFNETLR